MKNWPQACRWFAWGLVFLLTTTAKAASSPPPDMVLIPGGVFSPFFNAKAASESQSLAPFWMDKDPVTVSDYLAFLQKHPDWKKDKARGIFKDERYLAHWESPGYPGKNIPGDSPVTEISWFAARAYCKAQGKSLPTQSQWEWAAQPGKTSPYLTMEPDIVKSILAWHGQTASMAPPSVSTGWVNLYGVRGFHTLVWEWVEDFNRYGLTSDSRSVKEGDDDQFCGGGSLNANDFTDYPAFMRYAFRSSLQGNYTTRSLGFRCVQEASP